MPITNTGKSEPTGYGVDVSDVLFLLAVVAGLVVCVVLIRTIEARVNR